MGITTIAKQLGEEKEFIPVESDRDVLEYMTKDIRRSFRLTMDLRYILTELFGKKNFAKKGTEFFYYGWNLVYDGHEFRILTAKDKGTRIEKRGELDTKVVIGMLEELDGLLEPDIDFSHLNF